MKRKLTFILLTGVIILAAIMGIEGFVSPSDRRKQAEDTLKEKYQEEFVVTSVKEGSAFQGYYTVVAYSQDYPELLFQASIENESGEISDSYVSKRVCDRLSAKVSQNIGNLQSGYYVFTEVMLGDTLFTDPEISLEDYLTEYPSTRFTIYLCIEEEECSASNIVSAAAHMLDNLPAINGSIVLYLADAEMMAKIQDYVVSNVKTYTDFDRMAEEARIGLVAVNNGRFTLTEENLREMAGERL
ncbi:MAG: hypothetical protein LUF35_02030 [Lachnospiraceae bacterium]|nr:hypothetical protein [Lachnospiraceae bacterium]